MRLTYYTAVLVGLLGTAQSLKSTFDPITRPTKGETIQAGTIYTIEWNVSTTQDHSGPVNILLHNNDDSNDSNFVQVISSRYFPHLYSYIITNLRDSRDREQQRQIQVECQQYNSNRQELLHKNRFYRRLLDRQ